MLAGARADLERAAARVRNELAATPTHAPFLAKAHHPVIERREHEVPAVLAVDRYRGC
jgi:hypothetical protein